MSDAAQPRLRIEPVDGVSVVRFGESQIFSEENVQEVGAELERLVEDGHRKVLLDFTDVQYLSSAALGKLIGFKKKFGAVGGELKLADIHPDLLEVFKITRLDTVFEIHDTRQEALDAFAKG